MTKKPAPVSDLLFQGLFGFIFLFAFYYLVINMFYGSGLKFQTDLGLGLGSLYGIVISLWLIFRFPRFAKKKFAGINTVLTLTVGAFIMPLIIWYLYPVFNFMPFFIIYGLGIFPAFLLTFIIFGFKKAYLK